MKEFIKENIRFLTGMALIMIVWLSFITWLFIYGFAMSDHPCKVCADKMGSDITCFYNDKLGYTIFEHNETNGTTGCIENSSEVS